MERQDADSYYAASQNNVRAWPAVSTDCDVEVCIIGAGMTGCSAALSLAESGISCAVLEARKIGWGASGRSGGQMIVGLNKSFDWLARHTDPETAQSLWRMSADGIDLIENLCQKHDIQCDLTRGHYHVGLKERHARELEEMHAEYEAMGFAGSTVYYGDEVQNRVCSPLYSSALHDPISGHLHPLNYTLGLAQAAEKAGALLFEHSPVHRITQDLTSSYRHCIHLQSGRLMRARNIILASNAYIEGLEKKIEPFIMPVGTYIVATEPLGAEKCADLIPDHSAVADINFVLNYFRLSADHRMLFGGRATYSTLTPVGLKQVMAGTMRRVFPQLETARIDFTWGGYVAITQNRLPHIGRMPEESSIFFAQGYSGHGVILSTVCGHILAQAIAGDDDALKCFEAIKHRKFFGGKLFRTPALVLAMSYYKLRDLL